MQYFAILVLFIMTINFGIRTIIRTYFIIRHGLAYMCKTANISKSKSITDYIEVLLYTIACGYALIHLINL
jgi:hypothetical protein